MNPPFRKFALLAHIVFSIGWLGAVVAYLAIVVVGLTGRDGHKVVTTYTAMESIGWFAIVPFSFAALLSGLIQSLGTQWGLFRHWWVLVKFLLTLVATVVLLEHMEEVSRMASMALEATRSGTNLPPLRAHLLVHPAGGLLVLVVATVLSVFKPWGMTAYGRRRLSQTGLFTRPSEDATLPRERVFTNSAPRWVRVVGVHAIGVFVLFIVIHHHSGGLIHHLTGGLRGH